MALNIEIYSDVVCPWCWLGKRRLEKALEALPGLSAQITYLPYELNPSAPPEGLDREEHLTAKYGGGIAVMDARIAGYGREVGLEYNFAKVKRVPNTRKAHRLIHLAGERDLQAPLVEALHSAYFKDGKDLGNEAVLLSIAFSVGLDVRQAGTFLESGGGEDEVRELEEKAYDLGVAGVPFFVFGGRTALSGAYPVDTFVSILQKFKP